MTMSRLRTLSKMIRTRKRRFEKVGVLVLVLCSINASGCASTKPKIPVSGEKWVNIEFDDQGVASCFYAEDKKHAPIKCYSNGWIITVDELNSMAVDP